jgi:hypothetical protein
MPSAHSAQLLLELELLKMYLPVVYTRQTDRKTTILSVEGRLFEIFVQKLAGPGLHTVALRCSFFGVWPGPEK